MPADFYTVLGTADDASEAELRSAYRSRVREFHPDVNDSPDADAQFKLVRKAHDVLSNPVDRKTYDRVGHRDYVAKHFDSLPALSVFSHIDEADAPGATARSTNNGSASGRSAANGSSTTSSSDRTTSGSGSASQRGTTTSKRSANRTRTSGTTSEGQSASSRSTGTSRTSDSSRTGGSSRTTSQRSRSSTTSSTSSTSSTSTTSSNQRSSSSQNGASAAGATASAATSTGTASTRTARGTRTTDSTTSAQSGYTNEKPSHVGDQVSREEAERNVAERMRAGEQTVSAGQRRRRGLKRWYGVVVLSLLTYLGGLGAYAVQHLGAVQTLATQVASAPVPTLTAVGSLPSPATFALSPVAAQAPTLGVALLLGVVLLPLVLGTTVARYGRGSAWLYVLGSTVPVLALAAWMVMPVPLWAAVLALVAAPVVGAGAFLVDVGRYLSATQT